MISFILVLFLRYSRHFSNSEKLSKFHGRILKATFGYSGHYSSILLLMMLTVQSRRSVNSRFSTNKNAQRNISQRYCVMLLGVVKELAGQTQTTYNISTQNIATLVTVWCCEGAGQTHTTYQDNISQHCCAPVGYVWSPCSLRYVATYWRRFEIVNRPSAYSSTYVARKI